MLLREQLKLELKKNKNVSWEVIEQDYVLSWILYGISQVSELKDNLVFKGGTCLKKIYFGNYRFSQDLDFSTRDPFFLKGKLENLVKEVCVIATKKIQELGHNAEFISGVYKEKQAHPEGQEAYTFQAKLPWHREYYTRVYAEMTFMEPILVVPIQQKILHPYGNDFEGTIFTYSLEEIIAEKIRALLQFSKKLHERGWARSRVRDYYDLWRILKDYSHKINFKTIPQLTEQKCALKKVAFNNYKDIFQDKLMKNLKDEWEPWLGDMVEFLPDHKIVIPELENQLEKIFEPNLIV